MSAAGPLLRHRFQTLADASAALAEAVSVRLRACIDERGRALLAVPGGTTPARFLTALGEHELPWEKVTVLPTDERFVAPSDPASNERMIRAAFAPLRDGRAGFVSFHNAGDDLAAAAASLDRLLAGLPALDVVVSGMGADGHIASLFPGDERGLSAGPGVHAIAASPPDLPPGLSLPPAGRGGADHVCLLISGQEKDEVLASAVELPGAFPVGLLLGRPQGRDVYWAKA